MEKLRDVTLGYLINEDKIILALKKRNFATGKYNGYGGKLEPGETIEDGLIREILEESTVSVERQYLEKVAILDFYFPDVSPEKDWNQRVHVFLIRKWSGIPTETEEMIPAWYKINNLPFDKMWSSDAYWLSDVLSGKKITGEFWFSATGSSVKNYKINSVDCL